MNGLVISIKKVTLTVSRVEEMVGFYRNVFGCEFTEVFKSGTTFFYASLGTLQLLFCPNEIASAVAEQTRHQFEFYVNDLRHVIAQATSTHGKVIAGSVSENYLTLLDPDGNTLVFMHEQITKKQPVL